MIDLYAYLLAGIIVFVLGSLVRYTNNPRLLAGYNPKKLKDTKGLTTWAGNWCMAMGTLIILNSVISRLFSVRFEYTTLAFFVIVFGIGLYIIIGSSRFEK